MKKFMLDNFYAIAPVPMHIGLYKGGQVLVKLNPIGLDKLSRQKIEIIYSLLYINCTHKISRNLEDEFSLWMDLGVSFGLIFKIQKKMFPVCFRDNPRP